VTSERFESAKSPEYIWMLGHLQLRRSLAFFDSSTTRPAFSLNPYFLLSWLTWPSDFLVGIIQLTFDKQQVFAVWNFRSKMASKSNIWEYTTMIHNVIYALVRLWRVSLAFERVGPHSESYRFEQFLAISALHLVGFDKKSSVEVGNLVKTPIFRSWDNP